MIGRYVPLQAEAVEQRLLPDRPQSDFKALSGAEAWERIKKEQLPFLIGLYERWREEPNQDDFGAYRAEAYRHCAGLTHLWCQPFQAAYDVSDGRLLLQSTAFDAPRDAGQAIARLQKEAGALQALAAQLAPVAGVDAAEVTAALQALAAAADA